jgi:hypothetical protein
MARDTFDPTKTPGTFGDIPENAPRETSQPLSQDAIESQLAAARAHEKPLAPFAPPQVNAAAQALADAARQRVEERRASHTGEAHQPAASETDSPSRGIPQPILDPGKRITGGFGDGIAAQYFPITGPELLELVRMLMDQLNARLDNDLRFHIASVYPRLRARVVIEVEATADDQSFSIQQVAVRDQTPMEVARLYGDEVVFALVAQRQEFDNDGVPENPPDRLRDELGLEKPAKQWVGSGPGRQVVDHVPQPGDLF